MQDFDTLYGFIESEKFRSVLRDSMDDALHYNGFIPSEPIKAEQMPKVFEDAMVPAIQSLMSALYGE
ncbi:MAG: hypothetical protein RSB98_00945 [Raoultibacter sp.]